MRIGTVIPQTEIGSDPDRVATFVRTAEDLGYSHVLAYDHVLGAHPDRQPPLWGPYTHETTFHEPLVLFSYLAALTRTIELTTGVLVLPQRQTALVAKQAAEVDLLSRGRLRLGVGIGWNPVEYLGLGQSFTDRADRFEEQIMLLRRLWSDALVDFVGTWHRIDRAAMAPRPRQTIPIWFGGFSQPAFRRAARLGDGFLVFTDPESTVRSLLGNLERLGRDRSTFGIDIAVSLMPDDRRSWAADFERCIELGADRVTLNVLGFGLDSHNDAIEDYWSWVTTNYSEIVTTLPSSS